MILKTTKTGQEERDKRGFAVAELKAAFPKLGLSVKTSKCLTRSHGEHLRKIISMYSGIGRPVGDIFRALELSRSNGEG